MNAVKWMLIISGIVAGVFTPWQIQVVVMVVILACYSACYSLKLPRLQIAFASLFGGLSIGLGFQFLIGFGTQNQIVQMIISPLLTWLVLRVIFYGVETKYTLSPNAVLTQMRIEEAAGQVMNNFTADQNNTTGPAGTSAWAGDNQGSASKPGANGQYMRYEYFGSDEIAMGGPTFGEAIFSNGCAFSGVGPSIVLSDDGHYAAMTMPSRDTWHLLFVDLEKKIAYEPRYEGFWELDRIENGVIYGRESPITHNTGLHLSIEKLIANSEALPLIEDDGWWVIDDERREPFKKYSAITITSKNAAHKITFVPDLKPFKQNPFLRDSNPNYLALVDDELIEFDIVINRAEALWVDGATPNIVQEGRFLVLPYCIIDFADLITGLFSVSTCSVFPFTKGCDDHTNLDFAYGEKSDGGNGVLVAQGYVLPRSTGWDGAEYASYSCTSPWDEEEVTYWDVKEKQCVQARTRIQRYVEYRINLDDFCCCDDLRLCTSIKLINRARSDYTATLTNHSSQKRSPSNEYAAYKLVTSCGVTLENVLHEATWSHCGRYLAVVNYVHQPMLPHQICVIDFRTASIKTISGSYALPSFIWFDDSMLQFTHLVGVEESITYGANHHQDIKKIRLTDPEHSAEPYRLISDDLDGRRAALEKKAQARRKSANDYASGSLNVISQHCILFAPDFDIPVLQPPVSTGMNA
jgi:hypothetical protein